MRCRGLTLFELLAVMGILAVLATLVVPVVGSRIEQTRETATVQSLTRLREVIAGPYFEDRYRGGYDRQPLPRPGSAALDAGRENHPQLAYLFLNPETHLDGDPTTRDHDPGFGWHGPYMLHNGNGFVYTVDDARRFTRLYGETGDPAVLDGWGNPIVLQEPTNTYATDYDRWRHARLVSAGPDGVIQTPPDVFMPTAAQSGDDLVLFLWIPNP